MDENEMVDNVNDYERVCNSCAIYIALFVIAFVIINGISYFHCCLKRIITGAIGTAFRYINRKYKIKKTLKIELIIFLVT